MNEIPGWYSYSEFWRRAVATAPVGATLVEVGVFCGKSLADLARMAKEANKGLRIVGVDTFGGSPEHMGQASNLNELPPYALASLCMGYLHAAGVINDVTLIAADSVRASQLFASNSLHAVFLDADHSEEAVGNDIASWRPKVSYSGWLGGDDYWTFSGVKVVVDRWFPAATVAPDRCWWEIQKGVTG